MIKVWKFGGDIDVRTDRPADCERERRRELARRYEALADDYLTAAIEEYVAAGRQWTEKAIEYRQEFAVTQLYLKGFIEAFEELTDRWTLECTCRVCRPSA